MEREIGPVRPIFNFDDKPAKAEKCERLITGSKTAGMMIDITEFGIKINGYYTGWSGEKRYANLREPVEIPWIELERLKERIKNPKGKKAILDRVEEDINEEYLETLPIVTINKQKYYIDATKKERRSVKRPTEVWRWA